MNLERKVTARGCIEYVDPDMRSMPVPVAIPPGFAMYRTCANACCLNAQHCYFVDGDTQHKIEIALRDLVLEWLRNYFKVDHETLEPLEPPKIPLAEIQEPRIWLPKDRRR